MSRITIVRGDITVQEVDAVVNAANTSLMGGGGVDGAIHRAGGPAIVEECRQLRAQRYLEGLPTGEAVATTAGRLPARWVVHTVGPVYASDPEPAVLLERAHRSSLAVAAELGAQSVAFPAISCGVFGYPPQEAAPVAVRAVQAALGETPPPGSSVEEVRFVLFSAELEDVFRQALDHG